jgi:hypothetical protein
MQRSVIRECRRSGANLPDFAARLGKNRGCTAGRVLRRQSSGLTWMPRIKRGMTILVWFQQFGVMARLVRAIYVTTLS